MFTPKKRGGGRILFAQELIATYYVRKSGQYNIKCITSRGKTHFVYIDICESSAGSFSSTYSVNLRKALIMNHQNIKSPKKSLDSTFARVAGNGISVVEGFGEVNRYELSASLHATFDVSNSNNSAFLIGEGVIDEGDIDGFDYIKRAAGFNTSNPGKTTFSAPTVVGLPIDTQINFPETETIQCSITPKQVAKNDGSAEKIFDGDRELTRCLHIIFGTYML